MLLVLTTRKHLLKETANAAVKCSFLVLLSWLGGCFVAAWGLVWVCGSVGWFGVFVGFGFDLVVLVLLGWLFGFLGLGVVLFLVWFLVFFASYS
jgi:hypothetical protein